MYVISFCSKLSRHFVFCSHLRWPLNLVSNLSYYLYLLILHVVFDMECLGLKLKLLTHRIFYSSQNSKVANTYLLDTWSVVSVYSEMHCQAWRRISMGNIYIHYFHLVTKVMTEASPWASLGCIEMSIRRRCFFGGVPQNRSFLSWLQVQP